jgi:hypothetical protein
MRGRRCFQTEERYQKGTETNQQQPPDLPELLTDFPPCKFTFLSAPPPPIGDGLNRDLICPAIIRKAFSTLVEFFAEVSMKAMLSESANSFHG